MRINRPGIRPRMKVHAVREVPTFPSETLTIVSWPDEVIDRVGHDPRSRYVERFWLGVLGPCTTWLLRRIADELEASPSGFTMDLADTAAGLGVGMRGGRNSPFVRALGRLCQFELAQLQGDVLAVRTRVPSLSRRHIIRLPETLKDAHDEWQQSQLVGSAG